VINFKQRDEVLPSAIVLASIIIMTGTLLFQLLAPKPSSDLINRGHPSIRRHTIGDIAAAKARAAQTTAAIMPRLWQGDPDSVSAAVLAQLTAQTTQRSLKLGAFRPQRSVVLSGITELPYSVQITGPYAGIHGVLESIDGTGSKIVLHSVQIAASEEQSNEVSATLGLSAYIVNDSTILAPSTTSKSSDAATSPTGDHPALRISANTEPPDPTSPRSASPLLPKREEKGVWLYANIVRFSSTPGRARSGRWVDRAKTGAFMAYRPRRRGNVSEVNTNA